MFHHIQHNFTHASKFCRNKLKTKVLLYVSISKRMSISMYMLVRFKISCNIVDHSLFLQRRDLKKNIKVTVFLIHFGADSGSDLFHYSSVLTKATMIGDLSWFTVWGILACNFQITTLDKIACHKQMFCWGTEAPPS